MPTLLVTYDLRQGQDYGPLIEAIKASGSWWHHLDSTWLLVTEKDPAKIRDHLRPHLGAGDELLVIDVTGRSRAWTGFNERGVNWLRTTYK